MKPLSFSFSPTDVYLVAVSGGPDSMALLNMLRNLKCPLVICHVNYHKRKESDSEQAMIGKYAEKWHIPYHVLDTSSMKPEGNFQAWAREVRYAFFQKQYRAYRAAGLFVAHQEDDLLETYLMQKKRGGIVSYYGLKEETELLGMRVLRPLLNFTKAELEDYCRRNRLDYSIDASNLRDDYLRNRIRHCVVEKMSSSDRAALRKEIDENNALLAEHNRVAEAFLKKEVKKIDEFARLDARTQDIVLYRFIGERLPFISRRLSSSRIGEIKKILFSKKPNNRILLYPPFYFVRSYDRFDISESINSFDYAYIINEPQRVDTKEFSVDLRQDTAPLNIFSYSYPLTIRNARRGDAVLFGSIRKRVNRILIDEKVPSERRKTYPVIVDCRGEIVYIPLYRSIRQKDIANKILFVIK